MVISMYFDKAIDRINKIEWSKTEEIITEEKQNLGYEYLRRMANFVNVQKIKPTNPLILNVAQILGYETTVDYLKYCNLETQKNLKNKWVPQNMVVYYLQLADCADKNENVEIYLQIYDPMIRLLELGYLYGYREAGLMVFGVGLYPLGGWYNRFLDAPPIEI